MWTPKVISLIQIMFHAVNTLLALVPFTARHLQHEILYLLITFVVLTAPGFPLSTPMSSASVSADGKPWRIQMSWHLWGAETEQNMRRVYVLQSHHTPTELRADCCESGWGCKWIPAMRCNWSVQSARFYLFYLPPMAHFHCRVRKHSLLPAEWSDPKPPC